MFNFSARKRANFLNRTKDSGLYYENISIVISKINPMMLNSNR